MKQYELIDHTADVIVKAYGSNLEETFACAADAMFDLITGKARIDSVERVEIEVGSIDTEGLLVGFLSKLIVIHEVDGLVLSGFSVQFTGENRLRAVGNGERFSREKHGNGIQVKGVSYHMLEIAPASEKGPGYVQVLFDV